MKKILLIVTVCLNLSTVAQEWNFFTKISANSYITYSTIDSETQIYVNEPSNTYNNLIGIKQSEAEYNPDSHLTSIKYMPDLNAGLYLNSPIFLGFGLEYDTYSFRTIYRTDHIDVNGYYDLLDEKNTLHSLALPLYLNTSRNSYTKFNVFAGIKLHLNIINSQLQTVSWNEESKFNRINFMQNKDEFEFTSLSYFLGFSYSIIDVEFKYLTKPYFHLDFINLNGKKPYSHFAGGILNLKLSLKIKLN